MSIYSDLKGTMTEKKRENAKNDFFAFYVGRNLSYILTVPFAKLKVQPNTVSLISLVEVVVAGLLFAVSNNLWQATLAWFLFFLWNLLDGVDGNLARLYGTSSKLGSVWDATSGYAAMFITYFSAGIYSYQYVPISVGKWVIVIGALSGFSVIFPRLVMHKAITEIGSHQNNGLTSRSDFSVLKILALNLTSATGLTQPLLLLAILINKVALYTVIYFMINFFVMIASLKEIFKGNEHL